jgi:hypothetical protein
MNQTFTTYNKTQMKYSSLKQMTNYDEDDKDNIHPASINFFLKRRIKEIITTSHQEKEDDVIAGLLFIYRTLIEHMSDKRLQVDNSIPVYEFKEDDRKRIDYIYDNFVRLVESTPNKDNE